ncbi:t-complex protein 1 delta subunit (tcp-1-delta) [Wallemia mellicola]|uniref:T-complex protein 1 subunit delta n=1 Tax=Wallemia mellicola TaxID=1708541 RepID=A0AB38MZT9_9BASI|nr:t-complex protein 1 delta subunit (tcp-1-delta) [Wallemia mellicola]
MPKGGLLHAHTDATLPLNDVFDIVHKYGANIEICSTHPLTAENLDNGHAKLQFRPTKVPITEASTEIAASMLTNDYKPGMWCNYHQISALFKDSKLDDYIHAQMLISAKECYVTHNTMGKIWSKFSNCFSVLAGLLSYEPIWEEYAKRLVLNCVDDGVGYLETRLLMITEFFYDIECNLRLTRRDTVLILLRGIEAAKRTLQEQGKIEEFYGLKIIYCTLRFLKPEEIWSSMMICLDLYKEFPELIKGFDLVGHEDSSEAYTLKAYLPILLRFQELQLEEFGDIKVPFVFHAGETLGDGSPVDENLYDALLLGTRRIGHGYSLYKHPELMKMCKERGVLVESCPISNEVLRLTGGIGNHPVAALINHGVPVSLSSDDPAIFQNPILSYDFYTLLNHSTKTNLATLKVLARNSLTYSLMENPMKERVMRKWEQHWDEYLDWIVNIMAQVAGPQPAGVDVNSSSFKDKGKPMEVRLSNMTAAKTISSVVRSSLGPRGLDKMIQTSNGKVIVTNDGATILNHMAVLHPAARMLVELSKAQDVEAGDGTTSVVVLAGSLLGAAEKMLNKGIHPTIIAESFQAAAAKAVQVLEEISIPVQLDDRDALLRAATTSLNSKIVSQYSNVLAPIAVDAVKKLANEESTNVDLRNIRTVKKVGGTIDDTELVDGLALEQPVVTSAGGPTRIEKAKIGLIQFQLSSPKPDMDNKIVVNDYRQMDKILKEERQYLLNMCKKIKKSGCNVLLVQKSILRDAVNDLSLHFLSKLKIMVVKDIERDEIDFISKSTGCKPIADIEHFTEDKLGQAELIDEVHKNGAKFVKVSGLKNPGKTVSILCTGANNLVLEESQRSLHDALCVVRCLVKKRFLIAGGGAPEIHISRKLSEIAQGLKGMESYCFSAFSEALEVIPTTLAENAGLNPIAIVTELRNRHAKGEVTTGINVRKGLVSDIKQENVLQPLIVTTNALEQATETVSLLLRIDDYSISR